MKNYLLAGGLVAVFLLWMVSCAGFPGAVSAYGGSEENVPASPDAEASTDAGVSADASASINAGALDDEGANAGSDVHAVSYRRVEDVAAFADGGPESAVALMRAAGKEPEALYLRLREGFETAELDKTDPLRLPFEAAVGSTSPARVVINGGGRTVSLAGPGGSPLLTVGDGVTLTLRNITFTGTGNNTASLVEINGRGAKLVLGTGAVIQGNTNTNTASRQAGGILVTEGILELAGGEISGNRALGGGSAGSVYVAAAGKITIQPAFYMSLFWMTRFGVVFIEIIFTANAAYYVLDEEKDTMERKYEFVWKDTVGADLSLSRPTLGPTMRVEAYRLFQFTLRDILERHYGTEQADTLFREAGVLAGRNFYEQYLAGAGSLGELSAAVQDAFEKLGIGIFRVESSGGPEGSGGFEWEKLILTVDEDLDCSGLPDSREVVCVYDEGFIRGILECFTGAGFSVREIDCWCTGARTCRFEARVI